MVRFNFLALVVGARIAMSDFAGEAQAASPGDLRYTYVSLNDTLPQEFIESGVGFFPIKVTRNQVVYGTSFACRDPVNFEDCYNAILEWRDGQIRVLYRGSFSARVANDFGLFGGSVDPFAPDEQAALLLHGRLLRLPKLADERPSFVIRVTNTGIALIESLPAVGFRSTYQTYWLGRTQTIPADIINSEAFFLAAPDINELGRVGGTAYLPDRPVDDFLYSRAFRFVPPSGTLTFLGPVATGEYSNGITINNRGDVLGFLGPVEGRPRGVRIGVWRGNVFQTYYTLGSVAGTSNPELSLGLLWNEPGLIVSIGYSPYGGKSFILTKPGLRFDLMDIVDNEPYTLRNILDLNDRGDMTGYAFDANFLAQAFLLRRVDQRGSRGGSVATAASAEQAAPIRHATREPYPVERKYRQLWFAAMNGRGALKEPQLPDP